MIAYNLYAGRERAHLSEAHWLSSNQVTATPQPNGKVFDQEL